MKSEKERKKEKKYWKKAGDYSKKQKKESGKLKFKKRYLAALVIGGLALAFGTAPVFYIAPTLYAGCGIFSSKLKKFYYKKKIEHIKRKMEKLNFCDTNEEKDPKIDIQNIKKQDLEKEERPKFVKNLNINQNFYNAMFNEDGTYSMSKEQLRYLNKVQDKETMTKENINRICKMYGEDNTNTNPYSEKTLKKVA